MAFKHSPTIITDGLVLCLDAASPKSYTSGSATWYDLSRNGNNGTLTNGPTFSSENRGSIVFDGTNDYGSVPCSKFQSGNNEFSMAVWFKWRGDGSANIDGIFGYGLDAPGGGQCAVIAIDASSFLAFDFGSGAGLVKSLSTMSQNIWYYAIYVYDKSTSKLYLNGKIENFTNYSSANVNLTGSNGANAGIGCLFSPYGNVSSPQRYGTFNGNISIIKYYNRALSASEVLQNYNATKGRFNL
jgi:hypothetical protein